MIQSREVDINSWGGFGSQLFAVAAAMDLATSNPRKRFRIIFHTSGVTYRALEVHEYLRGLNFTENNDFVEFSSQNRKAKLYRQVIIKLLYTFRIAIDDVYLNRKTKLLPWSVTVRGSYTKMKLSKTTIDRIVGITLGNMPLKINDSLFLHYRLGDLLEVKKSSIVDSDLIRSILSSFDKNATKNLRFTCVSESPQFAKQALGKLSIFREMSFLEMSPNRLLACAIRSKIFVGTNSKLSLWIAIIRHSMKLGPSIIPIDMLETMRDVVGSINPELVKGY